LLAHFRLSLAVFAVSLAVCWWARLGILIWLAAPVRSAWSSFSSGPGRYFLVWGLTPPYMPYVLAVLGVAWLPVVPFIASDLWRLLRPRMNPGATRLRLAFIFASAVVVLSTVLLIRQYILFLFEMFPRYNDFDL